MNQWNNDSVDTAPVGPTERDLLSALITLEMRNYDLLLALVSAANPERADEIYNAHERGEHFNPEIFVPTWEQNEKND